MSSSLTASVSYFALADLVIRRVMAQARSDPVAGITPASKARWGLLKRALVRNATESAAGSVASASVRRHPGFRVLEGEPIAQEELARLNPPATSPADVDPARYQFVRYAIPQRFLPASGNDVQEEPSSLSPHHSPLLYFRLRRADSVSLRELAPDQAVDNTGNICVWNSEEVLAHVALGALFGRDGTIPPIAAASSSPALLLPPSSTPLRVLELGAGMSGLCGVAVAYSQPLSARIGEVLLTDGNAACVEGMKYQLAWNQQLHETLSGLSLSARTSPSVAGASAPRISVQQLTWDRNADYSSLGRFNVILAADW